MGYDDGCGSAEMTFVTILAVGNLPKTHEATLAIANLTQECILILND